jgi:hypothetical protein
MSSLSLVPREGPGDGVIDDLLLFSCEECVFCGTLLCKKKESGEDMNRRCKSMSEIRSFVKEWCRPTDYFYKVLQELKGKDRLPLCIPCVNWQRWCIQGMKKRAGGKKPMLLVDQFVMFMTEPGKTLAPDQRCLLRLVRSLKDKRQASFLLDVLPIHVRVMVSKIPADGVDGETIFSQLIKIWWEYNGCTSFFAHNLTAKLVRKMVKDN